MISRYIIIAVFCISAGVAFGQSQAPAVGAFGRNADELCRASASYRKFVAVRSQVLAEPAENEVAQRSAFAITNGNITIQDECEWQNTTAVAVNRTDPHVIAVASWDDACWNHALGLPVYVTDDGGLTWNTERLPRMLGWMRFGQPTITSDAEGRFYCGYTIVSGSACVKVDVSPDGYGWHTGVVIGDTANYGASGSFDGDANMAVDLASNSAHFDRVYIAWSHFDTSMKRNGIYLASSDDHGKTWSQPRILHAGIGGPVRLAIGMNGEVVACFGEYATGRVLTAVSIDGGATFEEHWAGSFTQYPMVIQGTSFFSDTTTGLKGINGFDAVARTAIVLDDKNIVRLIYATWDTVHRCAELIGRTSSDLGATWKDSVLIGRESAPYFDRFHPWLSHDAATGNTSLVYYSSEFDTANRKTNVIRKTVGEIGWESNQTLAPKDVDLTRCSANFVTTIGDYLGCDEHAGVFAAAWTTPTAGVYVIIPGQTNGHSDVMIFISAPWSAVSEPVKINADRLYLSAPYPNPSSERATVNISIPNGGEASLELLDAAGKSIRTILSQNMAAGSYVRELDVTGLAIGEYFLRLTCGDGTALSKLVIAR